jgi:HPt (histidine-containing phosphotransfer) domain-containing protein
MAANEPLLDKDFAIKQLGGNEELLEKMFGKFLSQYANDADKVNASIAEGDYSEAQRTIHGIKGVSGNLGLRALHQTCRDAEEILRGYDNAQNGALLTQHINTFESILKSTFVELENYQSEKAHNESSIEPKDSNDELGVEQAKATLVSAIDNFQFIAPPELQALITALKPTSIDLAQLEKAICDLDYELAKSLLNA